MHFNVILYPYVHQLILPVFVKEEKIKLIKKSWKRNLLKLKKENILIIRKWNDAEYNLPISVAIIRPKYI